MLIVSVHVPVGEKHVATAAKNACTHVPSATVPRQKFGVGAKSGGGTRSGAAKSGGEARSACGNTKVRSGGKTVAVGLLQAAGTSPIRAVRTVRTKPSEARMAASCGARGRRVKHRGCRRASMPLRDRRAARAAA